MNDTEAGLCCDITWCSSEYTEISRRNKFGRGHIGLREMFESCKYGFREVPWFFLWGSSWNEASRKWFRWISMLQFKRDN